MLDIRFIRENTEKIKEGATNKGISSGLVDELLIVDKDRSILLKKVEEMRAVVNTQSQEIGKMEDETKKKNRISDMRSKKEELKSLEAGLNTLEDRFHQLMLLMPSPALKNVPIGKDDTDNVEIKKWGDIPRFDFEPKDHVQLGEDLDILDIARGVKISGSRFYFLKNEGALLELAVLNYTLQKLVSKGFSPFIPPVLVQYESMMGTSYFPGGEESAYAVGMKPEKESDIQDDHLYLAGTSEVPVASYHRGEILDESQLPLLYAGISNCFRREAGTYGKDTHGLYRIHQFQKVEQVVICKNDTEESERLHKMILSNAEEVLRDLELPYRVVDVCTGDMGQGQIYKNDIETWMPSRNSYGETHSCSTFYEFQSRRLNLKYKDSDGKKQYCHTLNNTCIASPRILIPLLEIYQQSDGSVVIPEVLRPFMMGKKIISRN